MRFAILSALLLAGLSAAAGAQCPARTIPAVSTDLAFGTSMHPEHIGETRYRSTNVPVSRITVFCGKRGTLHEGELVLQPGRKVGFVLNLRHVELHQARATRMWFRPITVGISLQ